MIFHMHSAVVVQFCPDFTLRSMACSQRQQRWFESCHAVAVTSVAPLARLGFAEISSTGAEVLTTDN